jgi:hypothetical protein
VSVRTCSVLSNSGPNGEPLRCGYKPAHKGAHSWATLPTFVRPRNEGVLELGRPGSAPITSGGAAGIQLIASSEWLSAVCSSLGDDYPHVTAIRAALAGSPDREVKA